MKADIDAGSKANEPLRAVLMDEDKKRYRIANRRTVARKHVVQQSLSYRAKSFCGGSGDVVMIYAPNAKKGRKTA